MKVLHVIPAVAPRYGGPSIVLPQMCRALQEQSVDVKVAATDADGNERLSAVAVREAYGDVPVELFRRQWSESFKYSASLARWLRAEVGAFDVVHVHAVLSHACLAAGAACAASGVPYVVRPLGTLDPWSLGRKPLRKRLLLRFAGRRMLAAAAAIHYTTHRERELVEKSLGRLPGVVIPLGLDDCTFAAPARSGQLEGTPYLMVLSRLDSKKGIDLLLASFGRVMSKGSVGTWRLIIAGDGEASYVKKLRAFAQEAASGCHVEFVGWVTGEQKRALLQGASLFVAPSKDENFAVSLLEALAQGVPAVVSSGVHLGPEIVDAGAGWITDLEPDALDETLTVAMNSTSERSRRGEAAARFATRFAWSRIATQLVQLYLRVARSRPTAVVGADGCEASAGGD